MLLICIIKLVLPEGIELSTSPLPRECSTTELRQPELALATQEKARAPTRTTRGNAFSRERGGHCHKA